MTGPDGPGDREGDTVNGLRVLSLRFQNVVKVASVAFLATAGTAVLVAAPAGASTAPLISNGNAAYQQGSTSPPNQFNVLTLVTGGASAVNPSSLTVVSQPASGTATVTTSATSGIINYTPAAATTGVQTLTFAYCAPGRHLSERRQLHHGHHDLPAVDRPVVR